MFNKASLWLANGQNVMEVRRFFYKIQIGPGLVPTHNIVYTVYIREGLWIRVVDYDLDLIFFFFFSYICFFILKRTKNHSWPVVCIVEYV